MEHGWAALGTYGPPFAPGGQRGEHRVRVSAAIGESVFVADGSVLVRDFDEDSLVDQPCEAGGQYPPPDAE